MQKESSDKERIGARHRLVSGYPRQLINALLQVAENQSTEIYLVGGTVRDWLLGRPAGDLDVTVATSGTDFCRELIRILGGGALVQLGRAEEDAARVVWQGVEVDISSFRGGSTNLEEDLALRDYTVNSMAVSLHSLLSDDGSVDGDEVVIVDPLGGRADLSVGLLRHCPGAFGADPLRMLRGYRFMATLGFSLEAETVLDIHLHASKIGTVAAERISYELDLVMDSDRSCATMRAIHISGLLREILPELYEGEGVVQPDFHHLDVFQHNFQALEEMERLLAASGSAYGVGLDKFAAYLAEPRIGRCLKWAALFHDIGKPAAMGSKEIWETGARRVTFYGHDEGGRELFDNIARRLKWSNEDRRLTGSLIGMHMRPFHLCTVHRQDRLTRRAALKLCRKAGGDLLGLFLLAMADSLASRGELKPKEMEDELVALFTGMLAIYEDHIRPALTGPRLLDGRDLIAEFALQPGPLFSVIFDELEVAQVEGQVADREQALAWVADFLKKRTDKTDMSQS